MPKERIIDRYPFDGHLDDVKVQINARITLRQRIALDEYLEASRKNRKRDTPRSINGIVREALRIYLEDNWPSTIQAKDDK